MVCKQANRCLQCYILPVFEGSLCLTGNGFVDVGLSHCLKQIPVNKFNLDTREENLHLAVNHFMYRFSFDK